jgi:hypothetical protein
LLSGVPGSKRFAKKFLELREWVLTKYVFVEPEQQDLWALFVTGAEPLKRNDAWQLALKRRSRAGPVEPDMLWVLWC